MGGHRFSRTLRLSSSPHLEDESLVEGGIQCLLVDLGVELLLLVGEDKDLDVGVGRAAAVHGEEVGGLEDAHGELEPHGGEGQLDRWGGGRVS